MIHPLTDFVRKMYALGYRLVPMASKKNGGECPGWNNPDLCVTPEDFFDLWTEHPHLTEIGMNLSVNELLVVDIESMKGHGKDGHATWKHLLAEVGQSPPASVVEHTGTSGEHLIMCRRDLPITGKVKLNGGAIELLASGLLWITPSQVDGGRYTRVGEWPKRSDLPKPPAWIADLYFERATSTAARASLSGAGYSGYAKGSAWAKEHRKFGGMDDAILHFNHYHEHLITERGRGDCPICDTRSGGRYDERYGRRCFSTREHSHGLLVNGLPDLQAFTRISPLDVAVARADSKDVADFLHQAGYVWRRASSKPELTLPYETPMERYYVSTEQYIGNALQGLPESTYFTMGSKPVKVFRDGVGAPAELLEMRPALMKLEIGRHFSLRAWRKAKEKDYCIEIFANARPQHAADLCAAMVTSARTPRIHMLSRYPTLDETGALSQPGYNRHTKTYYDEPKELRDLKPRKGCRAIKALLTGFAGVLDAASMANTVSMIMTPLIRPAIPRAPLGLVVASVEGSGKTTLVDTFVGTFVTGRPAPHIDTLEREELAKTLFAHARAGTTVLNFDNWIGDVDNPRIADLITRETYDARILGISEIQQLPNRFCAFVTGNNLTTSAEIYRRSVPITFAPDVDPRRRSFDKSPAQMLREHRLAAMAELIGAIKRSWDREPPRVFPGDFVEWSHIVGPALDELNPAWGDAWLTNLKRFGETANTMDQRAISFCQRWKELAAGPRLKLTNQTAADLAQGIFAHDDGGVDVGAVSEFTGRSPRSAQGAAAVLSRHLKTLVGRPALRDAGFEIECGPFVSGVATWNLRAEFTLGSE